MNIKVVEVGPRDGLQNEDTFVSVEDKVQFINMLSEAGHSHIEVGAFVHPKWVPQMADTEAVFKQIQRSPTTTYAALVPNKKGYETAAALQIKEVAIFIGTTDSFNIKNSNATTKECLQSFAEFVPHALSCGTSIRAYLSTAFGCPYEGDVPVKNVIELCKQLQQLGAYEISISDTIGVAHPKQVIEVIKQVNKEVGKKQLALHFHDTQGLGIANVYAALNEGIAIFDASAGGLGGCPYAKGATGNIATEELLNLLHKEGFHTGIDMQRHLQATYFIQKVLNKTLTSRFLINKK